MTVNCTGGHFVGSRILLDSNSYQRCVFEDCEFIVFGGSMPRSFSGNTIASHRWAIAGQAMNASTALHRALTAEDSAVKRNAHELIQKIRRGDDVARAQRESDIESLQTDSVTILLSWIQMWARMPNGFADVFIAALQTGDLKPYLAHDVETGDAFSRPNEHPVYDPRWAEHETIRTFPAALKVLQNGVTYAANILVEAFNATPDSPGMRVSIGCIFRQAVAAADSVLLNLQHGASYMSRLPARALLEASLLLQFILQGDTEALGKRYYVASQRRMRRFLLELRSGSHIQEHSDREHRRQYARSAPFPDMTPAEIDARVVAIEHSLSFEDLPPIDQEFERLRGIRDHEPDWWFRDGTPDTSLAAIARHLNRWAEYSLYYETMSDAVHGRDYDRHIHHSRDGMALVFIRDPSDFIAVCQMTVHWLADAVEGIALKYLPDRHAAIADDVQNWRTSLVFPRIQNRDVTKGQGDTGTAATS